jgi:hypothetical protein
MPQTSRQMWDTEVIMTEIGIATDYGNTGWGGQIMAAASQQSIPTIPVHRTVSDSGLSRAQS